MGTLFTDLGLIFVALLKLLLAIALPFLLFGGSYFVGGWVMQTARNASQEQERRRAQARKQEEDAEAARERAIYIANYEAERPERERREKEAQEKQAKEAAQRREQEQQEAAQRREQEQQEAAQKAAALAKVEAAEAKLRADQIQEDAQKIEQIKREHKAWLSRWKGDSTQAFNERTARRQQASNAVWNVIAARINDVYQANKIKIEARRDINDDEKQAILRTEMQRRSEEERILRLEWMQKKWATEQVEQQELNAFEQQQREQEAAALKVRQEQERAALLAEPTMIVIGEELKEYRKPGDYLPFALPLEAFRRHCLVVGGTNLGKTRLQLLLLKAHLEAGVSAVVLDPKSDTLARAVKFEAEHKVVFAPSSLERVPGWNPLIDDGAAHAIADHLTGLIRQLSDGWGDRMGPLLRNALIVLASNELSLYELPEFLRNPAYMRALLVHPDVPDRARDFFEHQFLGQSTEWRTTAAAPLLLRVDSILYHPFFERCLCAPRNTFSFDDLWSKHVLALFHLDQSREGLGETGARLFGGLIAQRLFDEVHREYANKDVLMMTDEVESMEKVLGDRLSSTFSYARGSGLRLLLACQFLGQLSPPLLRAVDGNAGVKILFGMGPTDAAVASKWLEATPPYHWDAKQWASVLQKLPPQTAVFSVYRGEARVVKIRDMSQRAADNWKEIGGSMRLTEKETASVTSQRKNGIAAALKPKPTHPGGDDGISIP